MVAVDSSLTPLCLGNVCLVLSSLAIITPDKRQSKQLLTIDGRGSKSLETEYSIAICPRLATMAIENSVSNDFYLRSSIVLTFPIATYPV